MEELSWLAPASALISASMPEIDSLSITTVRTLCMDAVQQANSGHPGTPMAMAPVLYLQWQEYLRFDAEDPIWPLQKLVKKFGFTIDAVVSAATSR